MSPSAAKEDKGTLGRVKAVFGVLAGAGDLGDDVGAAGHVHGRMAWGCETHSRQLGRRAILYYDGEAASVCDAIAPPASARTGATTNARSLRAVALFLSLAIPSHSSPTPITPKETGINWPGALGALVALSLVIATAVISTRR